MENNQKCLIANLKKELERDFNVLTLDGEIYISILIYYPVWGINGRGIERAFVVLSSELTSIGYLMI